jgi:hypothetical protein
MQKCLFVLQLCHGALFSAPIQEKKAADTEQHNNDALRKAQREL